MHGAGVQLRYDLALPSDVFLTVEHMSLGQVQVTLKHRPVHGGISQL